MDNQGNGTVEEEQPLTIAEKKARTVARRKATIEAKKRAKEAEANGMTGVPTTTGSTGVPTDPTAIQLVRSFMKEQATVNQAILGQLADLKKDKCGRVSSGFVGESNEKRIGGGTRKVKTVIQPPSESDITSQYNVDSEIDSDVEARIESEMNDAHSLLQPKFGKVQGRTRTVKQIEDIVNQNRPFAFLDRERQRDLTRQGTHPEELDIFSHIEGLTAMAANQCKDNGMKGILAHIHQIIKDSQVHQWQRVRRWSNDVVFRIAMNTWSWESSSHEISLERHSQYVVPYVAAETEPTYPCFTYNRGDCKHDGNHLSGGTMLVHICSFCFALDGSKESHVSRSCGRRRSSSNYFKGRDDRDNADRKHKFRSKNTLRESEEKQSKN